MLGFICYGFQYNDFITFLNVGKNTMNYITVGEENNVDIKLSPSMVPIDRMQTFLKDCEIHFGFKV